jgi:hypothetical protein
MIMAVVSEAKFFEIKLDEFAPAVPFTQISSVCHYTGV